METMISDKVGEKKEKTIDITSNMNDLDLDRIIDQMENLIEQLDLIFSDGKSRKK